VRCATVVQIRRVPPPPKSPPYRIPEIQFFQIAHAALWLCPPDRDQFWQLIAAELQQIPEPGEGVVVRTITRIFLQLFRPPEISEEPRQLDKISRGSRRYEAKLDAIERRRTRRERSDAR
jgi:hypothetical protein